MGCNDPGNALDPHSARAGGVSEDAAMASQAMRNVDDLRFEALQRGVSRDLMEKECQCWPSSRGTGSGSPTRSSRPPKAEPHLSSPGPDRFYTTLCSIRVSDQGDPMEHRAG
jgi:hypothetical protein